MLFLWTIMVIFSVCTLVIHWLVRIVILWCRNGQDPLFFILWLKSFFSLYKFLDLMHAFSDMPQIFDVTKGLNNCKVHIWWKYKACFNVFLASSVSKHTLCCISKQGCSGFVVLMQTGFRITAWNIFDNFMESHLFMTMFFLQIICSDLTLKEVWKPFSTSGWGSLTLFWTGVGLKLMCIWVWQKC